MATTLVERHGSRRWLVVASFTLATAALVGSQLHPTAAQADASPVAARSAISPSVVARVADDRSPAPIATADPGSAARPAAPPAASGTSASTTPRVSSPTTAGAADRPVISDICSGPGWQVKRGEHILATLRDSGQRSGVTVSFLGSRAGYLGLTYPAAHHVDVFVRPCDSESTGLLRHVVSHEMGHAYDAAHMTLPLRAAYLAMRGIPAGTPWFGCSYCTDFATPAGDFAETYSQWQRGSHDSRTQMAPMPDANQLAAIAAAFFQS